MRPFIINIILILLFCNACAEKEEGCLDINATNYDVTADEDCCAPDLPECCCTYPTLTLTMQHKLGKDSLNNNADFALNRIQTVEPDSSHFFIVNDIRFYLSNLQLINSNGEHVGVTDSLAIEVLNDENNLESAIVEDNFSLIKRTQADYIIGNYAGTNTYDSIRFNIGIQKPTNHIFLESLPEEHILNGTEDDLLYIDIEQGFIFNKIILKKDTTAETIDTELNINNLTTITLPLINTLEVNRGANVAINLRINYLEWFKGINFAVDSDDSIKDQVFLNTVNVFEVIP